MAVRYPIIGVLFVWGCSLFAAEVITEKPRITWLFNDKGLEHWERVYEDGWSVEDSALVPSEKYRKNNFIWTRKSYGDFILTLQYKLSEGANSGLYYRSDPSDPVQRGLEVQLLDGPSKHSPDGTLDKHSNGALYSAVAPSEYNNRPSGEWNALLVYARGSQVTVYVNGDQVAFADFDEWVTPGGNPDATKNKFESALSTLPHSGKIGLQYHGDPVWFRHISVTELDSNSPDLNRITPRAPVDDADLRYWLGNMDAHGYSDAEASGATGLTVEAIRTARSEIGVGSNGSTLKQTGDRLRVMPYPGGRHPRIGFLDGGIDPQRETKLSVFLPWDDRAYVVLDVPEAIHSNLGLAYLAHTHVPTIWTASGMNLAPLEWIRNEDGSFEVERTFPNGIVYRVYAVPTKDAVHLRLTLTNNTAKPLSGLRVQNCVMLRGAPEFTQLTRENRLLRQPYAAVRNPEGTRWVVSAWEPCNRVWGNDRCPCFHSDPQFPDCEPGETVEVDGVLAFHEGADIDAAIARLDESDWGSFFERL
ncbi:MAG: hypothetical protein ACI92G_000801 [Candidatus Pelagisphaera sp.]|jgi:hypothetical protein